MDPAVAPVDISAGGDIGYRVLYGYSVRNTGVAAKVFYIRDGGVGGQKVAILSCQPAGAVGDEKTIPLPTPVTTPGKLFFDLNGGTAEGSVYVS